MADVAGTASNPGDGSRLFTSAFVFLSLSELAYFTTFGLMIPTVPLFAAGPLGVGPAGVGFVIGIFSVTALVLRPFVGRLTDRHGRRSFLLAGGLLFTVVTAAHLLATGLIFLMLLRILLGVAEAMFFVAAGAALVDLAPRDRLGEALSYNSLSLYLGIAVGPLLGELLVDVGGFRAAWIGGALLALLATLLALGVPETATALGKDEANSPLINRAVLLPGLEFCAGLIGAAGFLGFVALYTREVGMGGSGAVLGVYGAVVIVCRILFAKLPDRVPPFRLGAVALVLCAVGLSIASIFRSGPGVFSGAAVLAVGVAFLTPAFYRGIISRVEATQVGAAVGTFSIFIDLGLGGGPMLLGLVAAPAGIPAAFAVGAVLAALGAVSTGLQAKADRRGNPAGA